MAQHKDAFRWTFHPFEMSLVGYRNTGKTTLAEKLVKSFSLKLGYVKRDSHHFDMDHPGKDTAVLTQAGASPVLISDSEHQALLTQTPATSPLTSVAMLEADAVIVEGHKTSSLPKIVMLDPDRAIFDDPALVLPPLAVVGPSPSTPNLPWPVPYFFREDVVGIGNFIRNFWTQKVKMIPVLGLVLTGGQSSRMGQDKANLDYGRGAQVQRTYDLLSTVCQEVYVSCRSDQRDLGARSGLPQIFDQFTGLGPLSGILSAFSQHPEAAWLVIACDLPNLEQSQLVKLLEGRNPYRFATAFAGDDGWPEPLCALYEPKALPRLFQFLAAGFDCPRKMLINSPIQLLPGDLRQLRNVNSSYEREEVLRDYRG
ncbi:MAG: bifunctional molybdenum cofactor guanylyltransferase MobA/molybdopterin-guanine dinucleotide biosynthesis adaptor protein MobB [Spirochaetales bacterium]|nr:bifunctional molybdenum cofactor guanylyltransferase MobA/molybdopterin-guanine dinucleotide biosynthesis adaptor protein MobB [Spirochaetales bacterium]